MTIKRTFAETEIFSKRWKELKLNDDNLQELQNYILKNPNAGDIIEGTGGLIKLRWALEHVGKSGGVRVLYVDFIRQETVILINCYGKKEKDNISDKEKAIYKTLIKSMKGELNK